MKLSVPKSSPIHDSVSRTELWSCAMSSSASPPLPELQGWVELLRVFPWRGPLTFLTTAEHCQGQSHHQQCQRTPHVFFGCAGLLKLRAFLEVTEVLWSLLSGSNLYPVVNWRAHCSGFCFCLGAPKQSPSSGPGVTRCWQPPWHLSQEDFIWGFEQDCWRKTTGF